MYYGDGIAHQGTAPGSGGFGGGEAGGKSLDTAAKAVGMIAGVADVGVAGGKCVQLEAAGRIAAVSQNESVSLQGKVDGGNGTDSLAKQQCPPYGGTSGVRLPQRVLRRGQIAEADCFLITLLDGRKQLDAFGQQRTCLGVVPGS